MKLIEICEDYNVPEPHGDLGPPVKHVPRYKPMKEYAGDSVYVTYENGDIVLTTENGEGAPSNRIVLEPATYEAILRIVKRFDEINATESTTRVVAVTP